MLKNSRFRNIFRCVGQDKQDQQSIFNVNGMPYKLKDLLCQRHPLEEEFWVEDDCAPQKLEADTTIPIRKFWVTVFHWPTDDILYGCCIFMKLDQSIRITDERV